MPVIVQQAVESALAAQTSANEDMSQFLLREQINTSRKMDDIQRITEGVPSVVGIEGMALSRIKTQSNTIARLQQELAQARATTCQPAPPSSKKTERSGGGRAGVGWYETSRNTPNLTGDPRRQ